MATKKVIEIEVKDNVNVTSDHFEDLNKEIKSVESEVNKLNDSISKGNSKASESFKPFLDFCVKNWYTAHISSPFTETFSIIGNVTP